MDTTTTDPVTAHVDYIRSLLAIMTPTMTRSAVNIIATQGKDESAPTVGRLALIGTVKSPRVTLITAVSRNKVQVSYLTESGIRHGRTMNALNSHPIHLDSWPETYREWCRNHWGVRTGRGDAPNADVYAERQYEWALKTQAVYRAVKHCPWVAFAPIRNALIRREDLVMIPENGESQ